MAALGHGEKIEIISLIKSELDNCPTAKDYTKKLLDIEKLTVNFTTDNEKLFDKTDKKIENIILKVDNLGTSVFKSIDGLKTLLLTAFISAAGALIVGIILFLINSNIRTIKPL